LDADKLTGSANRLARMKNPRQSRGLSANEIAAFNAFNVRAR